MGIFGDGWGNSSAGSRPSGKQGQANPVPPGFGGGTPSWDDWMKMGQQGAPYQKSGFDQIAGAFASRPMIQHAGMSGPTTQMGMATLADILFGQGKTDPRAANQQRAGIQQGTQQSQNTARSEMAMAGLQGSNMGQALSAAIGQGGQNRLASFNSQEAQMAEDRKRQDLELLLRMVIDPALSSYGVQQGVATNRANAASQERGAMYGAIGGLGGGLLGGLFG